MVVVETIEDGTKGIGSEVGSGGPTKESNEEGEVEERKGTKGEEADNVVGIDLKEEMEEDKGDTGLEDIEVCNMSLE